MAKTSLPTTTTRKTALGRRVAAGGLALILWATGTLTQLVPSAGAQTGAFHATGPLLVARAHATSTVLRDGRVLVAGGQDANGAPVASAEVYNPATGTWSPTGSLPLPVTQATATLLADGTVLMAGGLTGAVGSLVPTSISETYNPATGAWSLTRSPLLTASYAGGAAPLASGKVLYAGGLTSTSFTVPATSVVQLYDPATGAWAQTGSLPLGVANFQMSALPDGTVLVAGGETAMQGSTTASAEIYQPSSGAWTTVSPMPIGVASAAGARLASGGFLVAGGKISPAGQATNTSQLFHPVTRSWSVPDLMPVASYGATATFLPPGKVLFAGGLTNTANPTPLAAAFDTSTGRWSAVPDMLVARAFGVAALLANDDVLVAGGQTTSGVTGKSELFALGVAPAITSASSFSVGSGRYNSFTVTATGSPTPVLNLYGVLPPGLTFQANNDGTATISGTPPAGASSTYQVTLTATNAAGTATQTIQLVLSGAIVPNTGAFGAGFWYAMADGRVLPKGAAPVISPKQPQHPSSIVQMAMTPSRHGYYLVSSFGGVFSYGDAIWYGSIAGRHLRTETVALAVTPSGKGYYLLTRAGNVFAFGDARFRGSTAARLGTPPLAGIGLTPDGRGYWLVSIRGNIFSFGNARFHGSPAWKVTSVTEFAPTWSGQGYWVVTATGKLFCYGDAAFHGSLAGQAPAPVIAFVPTPSGGGYWMATTKGHVFNFGNARYFADQGSLQPLGRVAGFAVAY
jgi:hypothetical protein